MKSLLKFITFIILLKHARPKMRCNGTDDGCCTIDNPCDEGDGDCDIHPQCKEGLICGTNNCKGKSFEPSDDCCEKRPQCTGQDSCCKIGRLLCGIGEGDCDLHIQCQEGLRCGSNNCVGEGFDATDDCCYKDDNFRSRRHRWRFRALRRQRQARRRQQDNYT